MLRQFGLIAAAALLAGCQSTGVWGPRAFHDRVSGDDTYGVSGEKQFAADNGDKGSSAGTRGRRVVRSDADFNTETARPAGFDNSNAPPRYPTDVRASDDLSATAVV